MDARRDLDAIREAALVAVDPGAAVRRALRREGDRLLAPGGVWDLSSGGRRTLLAAGKAAVPMARACLEAIAPWQVRGLVVTKRGHAGGPPLPPSVRVLEAGHPVPDEAGLEGASAFLEMVDGGRPGDLVLVLLSGGASALLPAPASGLTLSDLAATTDLLLRSGAPIQEVNAVRKHLSRLSGGQLARRAAPASVLALVLSDVVGDPLDVIASGPTVPDPTTFASALQALERRGALPLVPPVVRQRLERGRDGDLPETPKPGDPAFDRVTNHLVASNRLAAEAAVGAAERLGWRPLLLTTFVEGEAREAARFASALARGVKAHSHPVRPPACLVWGGETTVTVRGAGRGGRNQELALAAAIALEGLPGVTLMALATDGTDGPTDAAGAIVDGETARRAREAGLDPLAALDANDSYPLLDRVGALMRTGPTGTNVNDLLVLLVEG